MKRIILFLILSAMLSVKGIAMELESGFVLNPAKPLPALELHSPEKIIHAEDFKGHWSLLFFGFTQCQLICPMTLSEIKKTDALIRQRHRVPPQVVFISVDMAHDTPSIADRYAKSYQSEFIGLTGDKTHIESLTKALGVLYMTVKQNNRETIDHSANVFLINPKGELQAVFSPPYNPVVLSKEIEKVMHVK